MAFLGSRTGKKILSSLLIMTVLAYFLFAHKTATSPQSSEIVLQKDNFSNLQENILLKTFTFGIVQKDIDLPILESLYALVEQTLLATPALVILDPALLDCLTNSSLCPENKLFHHLKMGVYEDEMDTFNSIISAISSDSLKLSVLRDNSRNLLVISIASRDETNLLTIHAIKRLSKYWVIAKFIDNVDGAIPKPILKKYKIGSVTLLSHEHLGFQSKLLRASKLMECNCTSAAEFKVKSKNYKRTINSTQFLGLSILQEKIYGINAIPYLIGGTLLGWYRECGLIPYTSDMDIALRLEDWSLKLNDCLLADRRFYIHTILGEAKDSLEYTVYYKYARIDIFLLYHDTTNFWVGGMIPDTMTKLRYTYPLTIGNPCAAVLLGYLFHIPCNFEDYLISEYGKQWMLPVHQSNYSWFESPANVQTVKVYSTAEWDIVYRNSSEKILTFRDVD